MIIKPIPAVICLPLDRRSGQFNLSALVIVSEFGLLFLCSYTEDYEFQPRPTIMRLFIFRERAVPRARDLSKC